MPSAIIDLGTNTFHLLIFDKEKILLKKSLAAKLGMGGINDGKITDAGIERALIVLADFRADLDNYKVPNESVFAFGTSALRSATNKEEVIQVFKSEVNISVNIISGDEEANLIFEGVKEAVNISQPSLIVDIGGGSVEFIICNKDKLLWKESFEIGGQRLMEKFMKNDRISSAEISKLEDYIQQFLMPLTNAVHQYQPQVLIGSSGTFDTLNDMFFLKSEESWPPKEIAGFLYPIQEFYNAYDQLVFSSRSERMAIPGMRELRVDMIVVAMVLIKFLVQNYQIKHIEISNYALKEGAMNRLKNA